MKVLPRIQSYKLVGVPMTTGAEIALYKTRPAEPDRGRSRVGNNAFGSSISLTPRDVAIQASTDFIDL